jgi:hypothetical protein
MSTAFAAPACPLTSAAPTGINPATGLLGQFLGNGTNLADQKIGSCPTTGLLQQLLGNYNMSMPACEGDNCQADACPAGNCFTGCEGGNCLTRQDCTGGDCTTGNLFGNTTIPSCQR